VDVEISKMMDVLAKLGLVREVTIDDCSGIWNYAAKWIFLDEDGEAYGPTDEESDIIFICDNGAQAWIDKIDNMFTGDE